ncbi:TetR/AcrR family transcriptional regulator [Rhizobium daejeonense]
MAEEMTTQTEKPAARVRGPSVEKTTRTREQIIRAAMDEFLDKGYADATMAGIATRAGLAKGTTYRYFETKEALFAGIVRDIVTNPLTGIDHQPIGADEPVSAYCRRVMLPLMRNLEDGGRAQVARLVLAESHAFPYLAEVYRTEVYEPFLERLQFLAETAAKRGELKSDLLLTLPHLLAAPLWMGIVHNRMLCPEEQIDAAALFEAQVELLFR